MKQAEDGSLAGWYNVGPDDCDCVTTGELAELFVQSFGEGLRWYCPGAPTGPHEADFLKLNNEKIKRVFGWQPVWHIGEAVEATVRWFRAFQEGSEAANAEMLRQIEGYFA